MEDREIVNLYWERNSNAIKETASKYGEYCKAIAKNIKKGVMTYEERRTL